MPRENNQFDISIAETMCKSLNRCLWMTAPSIVEAGERFDITVVAIDHQGEVDQSFRNSIRIKASSPSVKLPKDYSFNLSDKGWLQAYPTGIVGVYADKLRRESIWGALWNRHCYGTTGAKRIIIDFKMDGNPIGSEYQTDTFPIAEVTIGGTTKLDNVDLIKYDGVRYTIAYSARPSSWKAHFKYCDRKFSRSSFYYLKVIQSDGEIGWAGPIWVDMK